MAASGGNNVIAFVNRRYNSSNCKSFGVVRRCVTGKGCYAEEHQSQKEVTAASSETQRVDRVARKRASLCSRRPATQRAAMST